MSINDQYDMSVFDGTEFEGLTYLQLRRRMTPAQLKRFKSIGKRQRAVLGLKKAVKRQVGKEWAVHQPNSIRTIRG